MHLLDPHLLAHWLALVPVFPMLCLSLLGLGGGGGLGISGSASTSATSGAPVTVYNGTSGPLSQQTWLIIGAVALGALLLIALIFRGRS